MEQLYSAYQHQSPAFQPGNVGTSSLRLFLSDPMVAYAILSPEQKILAVKEYRSKTPLPVQDMLDAALAQDQFLKQRYADVRILLGLPDFTLVPRPHFDGARVRELAQTLLKESTSLDEVGVTQLPSEDAMAVHLLPIVLSQKLKVHYPESLVEPVCVPLIRLAGQLSKAGRDTLLTLVLDHHFLVVALRGGKLALCNSYPWKSPSDVVYFMQLAIELMQSNTDQCDLLMMGGFETGSDLDRTVRQYLPSVSIPAEALRTRFEVQGDKLPSWKYAFLSS